MSYASAFERWTGHRPFPYQDRIGSGPWPELLDVPTGLGKTEAVLAAWLYRQLQGTRGATRRLVYCLPMRVLVTQTLDVASRLLENAAGDFEREGRELPTVHALLGGFVDEKWELRPESPAILVGTQDMLLSRALARGYGMSRYKWPVHFGLLHSDCLWVFDETQLMGVGVETSAQLQGLRVVLGTLAPVHSLWMSATLEDGQIETVDHRGVGGGSDADGGRSRLELDDGDYDCQAVRERLEARKPLEALGSALSKGNRSAHFEALADEVERCHRDRGALTLVVLNRVDRAQELYGVLAERGVEPLSLVHSRFRAQDRARHEGLLDPGDERARVVVATQAVEAGVDVSARTLVTELAPWPSLVQRFGRCNRYGSDPGAGVLWIDLDLESDKALALPYEVEALVQGRQLLEGIGEVGPRALGEVSFEPAMQIRPVLRRRDLLDLFDTSPDLMGDDIDVSRFIRDSEDTDVLIAFREFEERPGPDDAVPGRDEWVRVSIGAAGAFLGALEKHRKKEKRPERRAVLRAWTPDTLGADPWVEVGGVLRPGQIVVLHPSAGGYDPELGWTGIAVPKEPRALEIAPGEEPRTVFTTRESMDSDPRTSIDRWIALDRHLVDVGGEAGRLVESLDLPASIAASVTTAAAWHDVGKAHEQFQRRLLDPVAGTPDAPPLEAGPWGKSAHRKGAPSGLRPYFRHELASALAWLQEGPEGSTHDLIAYLIAAHHGKIRLSIRSLPEEARPPEPERLFARGVWDGDVLPGVRLPDGTVVGPVVLDLSPMQLGEGSWLERTLGLRDDPELGPFRLATLEALVRIADWRASEQERQDG